MKGSLFGVQGGWQLGFCLSVSALVSSCAQEPTSSPVAVQQSQLGGGGGASASCVVRDSADTTCDGVDDNCNGVLDEDCDFGPSMCPAGTRIITGTRGDDVLIGTSGRDCILGYGGKDVIWGFAGDDVLVGGPGDDHIFGGLGDDVILGGAGEDDLHGGLGRDSIDGGDGNDTIDGDDGTDTVHGGRCHDSIEGSGSDSLFGDDGSDRIESESSSWSSHIDGGNGIDACEGTSCEVSLRTRQCTRDSDCASGKKCVRATGICASPSNAPVTDATCDGIDDDCDGKMDEDYVSVVVSCGSGSCGGTGKTSCVRGHVQTTCAPSTHGTTDATCDGIDDDCDGKMDEDFASHATSCGVGACARTGTLSCVSGAVHDSCTAGTPAASDSTCNGVDDNCNGAVDEGFVSSTTSCGVGACVRSGSTSCVNGVLSNSCTPGAPAASDTSCDGIDDNCNGVADEGYASVVTTCGVGACMRAGSTSCVGGMVVGGCTPGQPAATDATCDGVDDNCNGAVDEGFASMMTSCGVGACARTGSTSCVNGAVSNSCAPGAPAPSDATCDGVDDNCNGTADEGFVGMATTCGVGACVRSGATSCVNGAVHDSCAPGAPAPSDATCDGVDNNCNGATDEGFVGVATTCGVGACVSAGATSCVNGVEQNSCTPGTPAPSDATCNGIDDNCNGATDEGFVGGATTCGVGDCVRAGSTSCVNGMVQNNCTPGTPAPSDTTCDGHDDNCNGATDEGFVSAATTCGVGDCTRSGSTSCVGGAVQDSCTPGAPAPSDATCDGHDDNCNGATDEGYASVATTCGVGACMRAGSTSCVGGAVHDSCTPAAPAPNDATCNNIDDNCNGATDEGFQPGCSGSQTTTCVGGQLLLTQCSDGNACNGNETCAAGVCQPGTPPVTDDGDPCTTDGCNPMSGVTHTPVAPGTSCSDGNVCNGSEVCLQSTGCVAPPSGMVAWWPGDGNAKEIVNHLDGTLTNGLGFAAAEVAQGFTFDGIDDRLEVSSHAAALNLAGQATLEFWVKIQVNDCRTVFRLRQDASNEQFLQIGGGCAGAIPNELIRWTYVNAGVTSTSVVVRTNPAVLISASFHHLAVTLDGTSTKIYLNGVLQPNTATGSQGHWGNFTSPTIASVGGPAGSPALSFSGLLDEVTLYDHALDGPTIQGIFNAQGSGKCKPSTCAAGSNAPSGTGCGPGLVCDGAGVCGP